MSVPARILRCGEQAFSVELSDQIDETVNSQVTALADALAAQALPGVIEMVPTYRSLLVRFDPVVCPGAEMEMHLRAACETLKADEISEGRHWKIPAVYGGEVGLDLEDLATKTGLGRQGFIDLHSAAIYRVYMLGFSPGFAYLGGLPEVLHTPRLKTPRQNVAEGAIGIGGKQANIMSLAGPSGWRYVAWTPVKAFDPSRADPFLFRAGDTLQFVPVSVEEGAALAARQAEGQTIVTPETVS